MSYSAHVLSSLCPFRQASPNLFFLFSILSSGQLLHKLKALDDWTPAHHFPSSHLPSPPASVWPTSSSTNLLHIFLPPQILTFCSFLFFWNTFLHSLLSLPFIIILDKKWVEHSCLVVLLHLAIFLSLCLNIWRKCQILDWFTSHL